MFRGRYINENVQRETKHFRKNVNESFQVDNNGFAKRFHTGEM